MAKIKNASKIKVSNEQQRYNKEELLKSFYEESSPSEFARFMLEMTTPVVADVNKSAIADVIEKSFEEADVRQELRDVRSDAIEYFKKNARILKIGGDGPLLKMLCRRINKCTSVAKIDALVLRASKWIDSMLREKALIAKAYADDPISGQMLAAMTDNYYSAIASNGNKTIYKWMGEFGAEDYRIA